MIGLSQAARDRMAALSKRFADALPEKISFVREQLDVLEQETDTDGTMTRLRYEAHRLAGTGATFGFDGISHVARALERVIDDVLDGGGTPSASDVARIHHLVVDLAGEADKASQPTGDPAPHTEHKSDPVHKSVQDGNCLIIVDPPGAIPDDIDRQLEIFGVPTRRANTIDEALDLSHDAGRVVLLLHTDHIADDNQARSLAAFRRENNGRALVAFVSSQDDFDLRLRAVRAGGDAFFSEPVDPSRVLERIDEFISPSEAEPFHILLVDDDQEKLSYHAMVLQQAGMITSVVSDPRHIFKVLVENKPDIILTDIYMPHASGVELVSMIRQQDAFVGTPIIFLSEERNEDRQLDALSRGADDFWTTPIEPKRLIASVRARAHRIRSMRFLIERDSLTGLLNHSQLLEGLDNELHRASRAGSPLAFAMLDIDHFKQVNDTYGHLTGDRVLTGLARLLRDRLRRSDLIGRYGGEEFGLVLPNTNKDAARSLMEKIREAVSQIIQRSGDTEFSVTVSCGFAMYPEFPTALALTYAADKALYAAKEGGRNQTVVADPNRAS